MERFIIFVIAVFLINIVPVKGQDIEEFNAMKLIGYWQTDSVNQLLAVNNGLSSTGSLNRNVLSEEMKQAIKSRTFIFLKEGDFTAHWIMGERQNIVSGKWVIEGTSQIAIEINGIKTSYSVRANGKDGVLLIPMKERHGQIHELYFTRKDAK
jgi:hypothetical protein